MNPEKWSLCCLSGVLIWYDTKTIKYQGVVTEANVLNVGVSLGMLWLWISETWHFFLRALDFRSMSSQSTLQFLMLSARRGSSWRGMYCEHCASIAWSWILKYLSSDWLAWKSSSLWGVRGHSWEGREEKALTFLRCGIQGRGYALLLFRRGLPIDHECAR